MSPERPPWFPTALFPFVSRFADVSGCRVHYVDEGRGPTLLFLHGNPTWSFLYRNIIPALSDRFRCLALDYPGFGLSKARPGFTYTPEEHASVVETFVKQLELSAVTLMVQDWGGPIGFAVAMRNPERFRAFIIGNTFAWPVNGDPHFERFSKTMGGPIGGFFIRHANAFVNLMVPVGVKRHRVPREVMQAYRRPFSTKASRLPTRVFAREILGSRAFLQQVADGLERLGERPALILWGDRDVAFRAAERERFERAFPNHRTIILDGAGHFIQEDAPDEIASAIRSWLTA
jgi:haloalkane dehalogenase